jgi:hypothetical protein
MIKPFSFLILAAGIFALAGCSSTPAKVDSGPIRARTFSFVTTVAKPSPGYEDNRQIIHPMVQGAISKNMSGRGVSQVASGGDVTVAYLIITGNNASTASINDYFGYGDDATALHEKAHKAYTESKNPNYFEAGTLVIDIIDTRTFKLLKRGYATRPILRNLPDDARASRIQEVVDEILRDVRVAL